MEFTSDPAIYTVNTTVAFRAIYKGVPVTCEISDIALQDHFGVQTNQPHDLVAGFNANIAAIRAKAVAKLPQRIESGMPPLLSSNDF